MLTSVRDIRGSNCDYLMLQFMILLYLFHQKYVKFIDIVREIFFLLYSIYTCRTCYIPIIEFHI